MSADALGWADLVFEPVREMFAAMLAEDPDYSAQLSAYVGGREAIHLWGGPHMDEDTLTGVFSSTKGVSALTLARLVEAGLLELNAPVSRYWPEFAARGKDRITVRQLLSHQAGLVGVPGMRIRTRYDSREVAAALAAMRPLWRPGSCFGYHGTSIGPLMEELFRRVAHEELQEYYARDVRGRYGVDFFIGTDEPAEARYRPVLPPLAQDPPPPDSEEGVSPPESANPGRDPSDDLASIAFFGGGPMDPEGEIEPNLAHLRAAGIASIGGVGSAWGLARVYAAAVTGVQDVDGGRPFLSAATVEEFGTQQCWGVDRVLGVPGCFGTVFQKPHPGMPFGSFRAIGHDGAGGSLGYADPEYELAFGYVQRRMSVPGGADPRALRLSAAVRGALRA
ncbi:serine hydrolase domain-containing protein [Schaalia naturae]|uniref:Serine hydrolase domain-containing protein n=1 Tax=Schaalia naturae TaxID=635203 RepID=A0ABW2SLP3_9ACTO